MPAKPSSAASHVLARQMLNSIAPPPASQRHAANAKRQTPTSERPIPVSDVTVEPVNWIFPGWIPAGKISVLFGKPGVGKSQLSLEIAARLTTGRPMPNVPHSAGLLPQPPTTSTPDAGGMKCSVNTSSLPVSPSADLPPATNTQHQIPNTRRPSTVLLFSAEDAVADTIRPRLEASGADCSRVRVFPSGGQRVFADPLVLAILIKIHEAALVIVDPLTAYAGRRDISRDQHMRKLLGPIADAAEATGAAILLIHHANKSGRGKALTWAAGSIAIAAAARSVMMVGKDFEDPSRRILAHVKGNLGPPPASLRFHFVQDEGSVHPHIHWDGTVDNVTADNLLNHPPHVVTAQSLAEGFLRDVLRTGPMLSRELELLAAEQGISKRTFARAKQAVSKSSKVAGIGLEGPWQTELMTRSTD